VVWKTPPKTTIRNANTTFNKSSGVYTNNDAFNIAAGKSLAISGNSQRFEQNAGTLDIQGSLAMTNNDFEFNGGDIIGVPTFLKVDLTVGAGSIGSGEFDFGSSGNTLAGDIAPGQVLNVRGGVSSTGAVTSANGFDNFGTINLETVFSSFQTDLNVTSREISRTLARSIPRRGPGGDATSTRAC